MRTLRAGTASALGRHPVLLAVWAVYTAAWTVYGWVTGTDQALVYLLWLIFAGALLMSVDGRVRFSTGVLSLLCAAGFFHMAGGNVKIEGEFLYRQVWWGFVRYDHLLHALGLGAAGLAVREATARMLRLRGAAAVATVTFLGANAVGAFMEIGEYLATLVVPGVQVGDYSNNMQDLIANLAGAAVASWWAARSFYRTSSPQPVASRNSSCAQLDGVDRSQR